MMPRLAFLFALLLGAGCRQDAPRPDAEGFFEADEITVSAEVGGRLLTFTARQGDVIDAGTKIATIDPEDANLALDQLIAQERAVQSQAGQIAAHRLVLEAQRDVAERERARLEALLQDQAAPRQAYEQAEGQVRILDRQFAHLDAQEASLRAQVQTFRVQRAQAELRLERHSVAHPVRGTVLRTLVHATELIPPGKPLYVMAALDTLTLKAWFTGSQLPALRLGQTVDVTTDASETPLRGTVAWISPVAEFTPRLVQTREERADLAYAVKIRVPNPDGLLKVGMHGAVRLPQTP